MIIPEAVRSCLDRLEEAGYPTWLVGGCVRDACLGLVPQDYDLCTAARPEQIQALFSHCSLVLAGQKHGTVGVVTPSGVVEITTFRTEGDYADSRHPQWVKFVSSIQEDLARRDFTVNAMAWSPTRGFADPFGGRADLENRILRAVGDPSARFREDALRILRGARFAARFSLTVEEQTLAAMHALAPAMEHLARERVFEELCKLISQATAQDLLTFAPILGAVIPELAPMIGFDQRNPHHAYDLFTHTAHVTGALPQDLTLRWAGLLHDTGKIPTFTTDATGRGHFYGHAQESARIADTVLRRLKAPTALREQVVLLVGRHMTRPEPERKPLRRWISRLGWDNAQKLLLLQEADMGSKGTGKSDDRSYFVQIRELMEELQAQNACLTLKDLAISGRDLLELGYTPGPALGACLDSLLDQVLEEQLPNERAALLAAASAKGAAL